MGGDKTRKPASAGRFPIYCPPFVKGCLTYYASGGSIVDMNKETQAATEKGLTIQQSTDYKREDLL